MKFKLGQTVKLFDDPYSVYRVIGLDYTDPESPYLVEELNSDKIARDTSIKQIIEDNEFSTEDFSYLQSIKKTQRRSVDWQNESNMKFDRSENLDLI